MNVDSPSGHFEGFVDLDAPGFALLQKEWAEFFALLEAKRLRGTDPEDEVDPDRELMDLASAVWAKWKGQPDSEEVNKWKAQCSEEDQETVQKWARQYQEHQVLPDSRLE